MTIKHQVQTISRGMSAPIHKYPTAYKVLRAAAPTESERVVWLAALSADMHVAGRRATTDQRRAFRELLRECRETTHRAADLVNHLVGVEFCVTNDTIDAAFDALCGTVLALPVVAAKKTAKKKAAKKAAKKKAAKKAALH